CIEGQQSAGRERAYRAGVGGRWSVQECRDGSEEGAAAGRAVGVDVALTGTFGHHDLAVEQNIERRGILPFLDDRARRGRVDTRTTAHLRQLCRGQVLEQEQ